MIDLTTIPSTSPLLEAGLLDQLGQVLAKMKLPVTLKAVVDLEDKNCQEMAAFHIFSCIHTHTEDREFLASLKTRLAWGPV